MLPTDLPICAIETPLKVAMASGPVVVTSPTGSGKSTWIPVWAAEVAHRVLVVEPRRVACRSLARFVAASTGSRLGRQVGYAVRHDDRLGPETSIGYVTPGVALRLLERPLDATLVILDEFHQRGLETDLLLSVLLARGHRRLAVLSATLDGPRVAQHVGGELLKAHGRQYPVDVRHVGQDALPGGRQLVDRVLAALEQLRGQRGDVLVFLPGKAEIMACQQRLAGHPELAPVPLHAQLAPEHQDQAFAPAPGRRVILSTNVAETSVTLPGVRAVVDCGLVRRTVYREGRGALSLLPVALDAADQRAGRAGRLGPGVCLRLWSAAGKLEPHTPPEVLREDLSQLVLQAAQLGHRVEDLPWLDAPRDYAVDSARRLLGSLQLLDSAGQLTAAGRQVGRLPLDPALGRLLLAARRHQALPDMLLLVASLAAGRPLFAAGHPTAAEGSEPDALTEARCDATARILALRDPSLARGRLRREALAEAQRVARQLARMLDVRLADPGTPVRRAELEQAIIDALPDAAFARRPRRDQAWGNGKVELKLSRDSLIEQRVQTVLVVDQHLALERGRSVRRFGSCCLPLPPGRLRALGAGQVHTRAARVDAKGQLLARLEWAIGTTVLERFEQVPTRDAARQALKRLLLEGRHMAPEVNAARDELEAHSLRSALDGGGGGLTLERWLEQRLQQIGFEDGADLPLLTAQDLQPGLLTEQQQAEVDRDFPRQLTIGGMLLRATYDVGRRRVTLQAKARGRPPPREDFLPRWPGWSVAYHDGKHSVLLRQR